LNIAVTIGGGREGAMPALPCGERIRRPPPAISKGELLQKFANLSVGVGLPTAKTAQEGMIRNGFARVSPLKRNSPFI
jgi:hypothetical protein